MNGVNMVFENCRLLDDLQRRQPASHLEGSAAAAAQSVVHDADGNTTAGPLPDLSSPAAAARWASFGFDARNRLSSITATGVSGSYSYDAENLRYP